MKRFYLKFAAPGPPTMKKRKASAGGRQRNGTGREKSAGFGELHFWLNSQFRALFFGRQFGRMGQFDGDAPVAIETAAEDGERKCRKYGETVGRENQFKSSQSEGVLTPQV
jgi:hypothetical protein